MQSRIMWFISPQTPAALMENLFSQSKQSRDADNPNER